MPGGAFRTVPGRNLQSQFNLRGSDETVNFEHPTSNVEVKSRGPISSLRGLMLGVRCWHGAGSVQAAASGGRDELPFFTSLAFVDR
jgi:hypothetical protein